MHCCIIFIGSQNVIIPVSQRVGYYTLHVVVYYIGAQKCLAVATLKSLCHHLSSYMHRLLSHCSVIQIFQYGHIYFYGAPLQHRNYWVDQWK